MCKSAGITSTFFLAADGALAVKDFVLKNWLQGGDVIAPYLPALTSDSLAGACFVTAGFIFGLTKKFPRGAFRAVGIVSGIGLTSLAYGGIDWDMRAISDAGRLWVAGTLAPSVGIILFENEISNKGKKILRSYKNAFACAAGHVMRYSITTAGVINFIATLGFFKTFYGNPRVEWPMLVVGILNTIGSIGLGASDQRMKHDVYLARIQKASKFTA